MRSTTTTTSNNGTINDQDGASTWSDAHLLAIADTPTPADRERANQAAGKSKAAPKAATALGRVSKAKASSSATWRTVETAPPPKQAPVTPPQKGGKD